MKEKVLVVPRSRLFPDGAFHGFSDQNLDAALSILAKESFFMDRKEAEDDPSHKQIIPYAVLTSRGAVFTVTRLKGQGEARLHSKISIGLGGHINPEDAGDGGTLWEAGLRRELSEEMLIEEPWEARLVGLINDDTVPVGSVHFGLVYHVELPLGKATIREKKKMIGSFFAPEEAFAWYDRMETWSSFAFAAFWPELAAVPRVGTRS